MGGDVTAVVCIPSFRRPEGLRRTLESLARQQTEVEFATVVVDNDAEGQEALPVARQFFAAMLKGHAVVEAQQGNVHAINTAFATALALYPAAQYFLMIDDDEHAEPGWLDAMIGTAAAHDAQIVGGPVLRTYSTPVPNGVSRHPLFHSIEASSGPISIIHGSGNCLISRAVFERLGAPYFDPAYNFLGGGDMDFFTRARAASFDFAWAEDGLVHETVGAARLSARWIMERSLRTGAINYAIDRKHRPGVGGWIALSLKNAASLLRGTMRFVGSLLENRHILPASHWLLMPLGRVLASFGWSTSPYKAAMPGEAHAVKAPGTV